MKENQNENWFQRTYFSEKPKKRITAYLLTFAIILFVAVLVLTLIFNNKTEEKEEYIPTPMEIFYGFTRLGEIKCDLSNVKAYISSENGYFGYSMKDEYSMIYQLRSEEEKASAENYLLLEEKLPEIDFSKNYLLLSVGRRITDINKNLSTVDEKTGEIVSYILYEEQYTQNTVFVYSMNCVKFMNGADLDYYLWRTASDKSNIVEAKTDEKTLISEGDHFKMYSYSDSKTEYVLIDKAGNIVEREMIEGTPAQITEYSPTMIKIDLGDKNYYFNSETGGISYYYEFKTEFFKYNIISYMRLHKGELQLILRDAYDETRYAKIIKLDFATDIEDIDTLVQKVEYVDKYTVSVTFVKGKNHTVSTETVSVYNMDRY